MSVGQMQRRRFDVCLTIAMSDSFTLAAESDREMRNHLFLNIRVVFQGAIGNNLL
jgi:hypothetical protein